MAGLKISNALVIFWKLRVLLGGDNLSARLSTLNKKIPSSLNHIENKILFVINRRYTCYKYIFVTVTTFSLDKIWK